MKALSPKRWASFFTYRPPSPRYLAMPSSSARGVMVYCGKPLWKKRAFATLDRDISSSRRSSVFGIWFNTHLIFSIGVFLHLIRIIPD